MKFEKIEDLLWRVKGTFAANTAQVDKRFLESLYPNATIHMQKSHMPVGVRDQYKLAIQFESEADEAEFILKEMSDG